MKKMKPDTPSHIFHDLLGEVTAIRNALHFLLSEKSDKLDQETKKYLEEALKKCENLVGKVEELRKEILNPNY